MAFIERIFAFLTEHFPQVEEFFWVLFVRFAAPKIFDAIENFIAAYWVQILSIAVVVLIFVGQFFFAAWKSRNLRAFAILELIAGALAIGVVIPWPSLLSNSGWQVPPDRLIPTIAAILGGMLVGAQGFENLRKANEADE